MRARTRLEVGLLAVLSAGVLTVAACGPIPTVIDTPKDGDRVAISVDQPMTVRWSNQSPELGSWSLEKAPTAVVTLVKHTVERPPGGAFALDVFDFKGAQKGADKLTFVYLRKDGTPPRPEERVTVDLAVG